MLRRIEKPSRRGFAIITVVFVIGILLLLASAVTFTAIANSRVASNGRDHERAYDVAESAVSDVFTKLGNGTIRTPAIGSTAIQTGTGSTSQGTYKYWVLFNNKQPAGGGAPAPSDAVIESDPLAASSTCNSAQPYNPGTGCVAVPAQGALVAVTGTYAGRSISAEAMGTQTDLNLGGDTMATRNNSGQNGQNANILADSTTANGGPHDVKIITNGNWNVAGNPTVDGSVATVGTGNAASAPAGCGAACSDTIGATPFQFPSSNSIAQAKAQWILDSQSSGCYYTAATLPSSIFVAAGKTCYVDTSVDFKSTPTTNDGGKLIVAGQVRESGNNARYQLSAACQASCSCHKAAWLIVLSTSGASVHGVGSQAGVNQSVGIVYVPSGPFVNIGNALLMGAVVADSAQIGGTAGMQADACANIGSLSFPGFNMTAFGQY
ncbi:MAG: hypothetical protein GIW99_07010 [Candidatus Eremiobacteraeota bacterium]|nr:hypothetical protein [Candidatus Eremiobacteraeota bacterium]MBC5827413.1 hypothetical protein [Candidatus Eremiobacteraeota bacterium]